MTRVPCFRRFPIVSYFALTYGISWGGILVVLGSTGFDLNLLRPLDTGLIFICMLLGPSIAGLSMTVVLDGRAGLRELRSRLLRWRLALLWYALALLTMPVLVLAVLWPFSLIADPAFAPRFQWTLFVIGLVAGTFEEIGWTGFATPRLLIAQRTWVAGLLLGLVWAMWHLLVDFRQNYSSMGDAWMVWLLSFTVLREVAAGQRSKAMGGSFVKVVGIGPQALAAILAKADKQGLDVAGHLSDCIDAVDTADAGSGMRLSTWGASGALRSIVPTTRRPSEPTCSLARA